MNALEGIRVIDASESISGQFCARLFADHGAEVVLVEPPTGSHVRHLAPFRPGDTRESLLFHHLNHGKHSVTLDWSVTSGRFLFLELARESDVVILGPHVAAKSVRRRAPNSIVVTISDFGTSGPLANWRGLELIHQAMSGVMYETGKPSKYPLYGCGNRAYYAAGVVAYTGLLSALFEREKSGLTQELSVEVAETAASMNYCRATQWNYSHMYDRRGGTKRPMAFVKCSDRWICLFPSDRSWRAVCTVLGATELLNDESLTDALERQRRWKDIIDVLQEKVRDRKADEVVETVQKVGGVAGRAYTPAELRHTEHLSVRNYWESVITSQGERLVLGPMFRMSETPRHVAGGAPELGDRNAEAYRQLSLGEAELGALKHEAII